MANDNFNDVFKAGALEAGAPVDKKTGEPQTDALGTYDDKELLDLFEVCKKESFSERWVFERQWLRNIFYVIGRQWITYHSRDGAWKDIRQAKWIPRPVTNKCGETVQAIRAMFTSIKLGVNNRPNGQDPDNVSTASTADQLAPLLHDLHNMDGVTTDGDWWLCVTGNIFYHTFWDYDPKYGILEVSTEQCMGCGNEYTSDKLAGAQPVCPDCGGTEFTPALGEAGEPKIERRPKGKGVTLPLSPFEVAFPNQYSRFDDLPYIIRLRWRTKRYYEGHPQLKDMVGKLSFSKSPADRSLQIFKSLATQNDLGIAPVYWAEGSSTGNYEEGCSEYELWYKPTDKYPDGLVVRIAGDSDPKVLHLEETENIPGPLPYRDAEGNGLFTFAHSGYEHVGGRLLATGPIDRIIQKQDQLNQLDSMFQMIIQRVANPLWFIPKGASVSKITGEPGLMVEWDSHVVAPGAKPERIAGEGPHGSLFTLREQYLKDIEELAGTFDIIKGAKPTGVEAFSALQLLVERSQSRFSGVFQSRGNAYKEWFKFALELEREFGPDERTKAVLTPARTYTFKTFKKAQLQGSITTVVEDGSNVPKTALGKRAAIEHANQLGLINPADPDQKYAILTNFGLTDLVPTLDVHVQAALQKQQAFEEWVMNPQAVEQSMNVANQEYGQFQQQQQQQQMQFAAQQTQFASQPPVPGMQPPMPPPIAEPPSPLKHTPLAFKKWYDPVVHRQEFMKWANSDRIRELLRMKPQAEGLLEAHLAEIDLAMAMAMQPPLGQSPPGQPGGGGAAMANSNREATTGNEPRGQGEGAQNQGPA